MKRRADRRTKIHWDILFLDLVIIAGIVLSLMWASHQGGATAP